MKKPLLLFLLLALTPLVSASTVFNESFTLPDCTNNCWDPSRWTLSTSHSLNFRILGNTGRIEDTTAAGDPTATADVLQTASALFNFTIMWITDTDDSSIVLQNTANASFFVLRANAGSFTFLNSSTIYQTLSPMTASQWYNITAELNVITQTVDVYLNNTLVGDDLSPFSTIPENLGRLQIKSQGSGIDSDHAVDNISIEASPLNLTFAFFDENTRESLSGVSWVVTDTINNTFNGTGSTGNVEGLQGEYEIQYTKDTHFLRRYYIDLTGLFSLNLYSLNQSTTNANLVTYEVTDNNGIPLPNVTIKALRFYPELNSHIIVEMSISDTNGQGGLHLEQIDPKYRFIAEILGNVVFTGSASQIFSDSVVIRIDQSEDVLGSLTATTNISSGLSYDNSTGNYQLTFNDPTGITQEVCLTIRKQEYTSRTQINRSCLNSSSGTITLGIGIGQTGQYIATGTLETNTQFSFQSFIQRSDVLSRPLLVLLGGAGYFLSFMIIVGLALGGLFLGRSPAATVVMGLFGIVLSSMLGLLPVGLNIIIGLVTVGLLVLFLTKSREAGT